MKNYSEANCDAEEAVVATVLANPEIAPHVLDLLPIDAFFYSTCRAIYDAIHQIASSGGNPDLAAVSERCRASASQKLATEIDAQLAAILSREAIIPAQISSHIDIVLKLYAVRTAIYQTNEIQSKIGAVTNIEEIGPLFDRATTEVSKVLSQGRKKNGHSGLSPTGDCLARFGAYLEREDLCLATGLEPLDEAVRLERGDLFVLGGRSSMGKTWLGLALAYRLAIQRKNVAIFSLEMTTEQIIQRLLAYHTGIPASSITSDAMQDPLLGQRISEGFGDFSEVFGRNLFIDDRSSIQSRSYLDAQLRRAESMGGPISCVVVDYLQLLANKRAGDMVSEVGYWSQALKDIAKKHSCLVIALSQLNRAADGRNDKRPLMSDLRNSGDIEQDSDVVGLVYRDSYYNDNADPNHVELLIRKNRRGSCGTVALGLDRTTGRISYGSFCDR